MTARHKIILSGSLLLIIFIVIFAPIRTGKIETGYIKSLVSAGNKITVLFEEYEKEKNIKDKNLSKFCLEIKEKYPLIALIAISDDKKNLLVAGKNDSYIQKSSIYDSIIDKFLNDQYKTGGGNNFLIRYFDQTRFYIFVRNTTGGKLLIIFPYKLPGKTIVQVILEIVLIIIIALAATAAVYLRQKRKEAPYNAAHLKIISKLRKEKTFNKNSAEIIKRVSDSALNYLNEYIYELFEHLSSIYQPAGISLFLLNKETAKLDKMYELKSKTFIKADGSAISTIDINNEIGEELKKSSVFIQDQGRKVTLPIIYKKSLLGTVILQRENSFKGPEINAVKSHLALAAKPVGQYLQFE